MTRYPDTGTSKKSLTGPANSKAAGRHPMPTAPQAAHIALTRHRHAVDANHPSLTTARDRSMINRWNDHSLDTEERQNRMAA